MSWIDEPDNDLPCIYNALEDTWYSIRLRLETMSVDEVKLPSGKRVPFLEVEAEDCTICGKDESHQWPFWSMRELKAACKEQSKRKGWMKLTFQRNVLPDGKNRAIFRMDD